MKVSYCWQLICEALPAKGGSMLGAISICKVGKGADIGWLQKQLTSAQCSALRRSARLFRGVGWPKLNHRDRIGGPQIGLRYTLMDWTITAQRSARVKSLLVAKPTSTGKPVRKSRFVDTIPPRFAGCLHVFLHRLWKDPIHQMLSLWRTKTALLCVCQGLFT